MTDNTDVSYGQIGSQLVERAVTTGGNIIPSDSPFPDTVFERRFTEIAATSSNEYSVIVITDAGDADGVTCGALYRAKYGDQALVLPALTRSYGIHLNEALGKIIDTSGDLPVYVADLGPDDQTVEILEDADVPIFWRDHHNVSEEAKTAVEATGGEYVHDPNRAASKIVFDTDHPDAAPHLRDLVSVANVRDMWQEDHPRFEESSWLSDLVYETGFGRAVEILAAHGMGFTDECGDIMERIELRRAVREGKIEHVVANADVKEFRETRVAIGYGDCYQSGAGTRLRDEYDAPVAVIIKPSGKVSIRTAESHPVAAEIASQFDGGGHDCAAGCEPDVDESKDEIVASSGAPIKEAIEPVVEDVLTTETRLR